MSLRPFHVPYTWMGWPTARLTLSWPCGLFPGDRAEAFAGTRQEEACLPVRVSRLVHLLVCPHLAALELQSVPPGGVPYVAARRGSLAGGQGLGTSCAGRAAHAPQSLLGFHQGRLVRILPYSKIPSMEFCYKALLLLFCLCRRLQQHQRGNPGQCTLACKY